MNWRSGLTGVYIPVFDSLRKRNALQDSGYFIFRTKMIRVEMNIKRVFGRIVAVAAGVICHYIIKWLDGDR